MLSKEYYYHLWKNLLIYNAIFSHQNGYDMYPNEELFNVSTQILLEINELIDKEYSYEEIYEMIEEANFGDDFSEEDKTFIREDAKRLLKRKFDC